jgi:ABC-type Na+ transport system ATPase subunit NatA
LLKSDLVNLHEKTAIWATHDLPEAGSICDEIAILSRGQVVIQGNINNIKTRLRKKEIFKIEVKANKDPCDQILKVEETKRLNVMFHDKNFFT